MERRNMDHSRKLGTTGIWILIMSLFIGELLFYTWCRVQCIRTGYEITRETEKHEKLIKRQNNLKIEISRLKSPERIARIAKFELGLALPGPGQVIVVNEAN